MTYRCIPHLVASLGIYSANVKVCPSKQKGVRIRITRIALLFVPAGFDFPRLEVDHEDF